VIAARRVKIIDFSAQLTCVFWWWFGRELVFELSWVVRENWMIRRVWVWWFWKLCFDSLDELAIASNHTKFSYHFYTKHHQTFLFNPTSNQKFHRSPKATLQKNHINIHQPLPHLTQTIPGEIQQGKGLMRPISRDIYRPALRRLQDFGIHATTKTINQP